MLEILKVYLRLSVIVPRKIRENYLNTVHAVCSFNEKKNLEKKKLIFGLCIKKFLSHTYKRLKYLIHLKFYLIWCNE